MTNIPVGSTQKNVNRDVYRILFPFLNDGRIQTLIDVPCGVGSFAGFVKNQHPKVRVIGADIYENASANIKEFYRKDVNEFLKDDCPRGVDAVVCISGVMCFGNIEELFRGFSIVLKNKGTLIVTNDNILTVRDRLSFLFFGYFKRFQPFFSKTEGNWNVVLPQEIVMHMQKNDFKDIQIHYTSIRFEDLLFLPLCLVIFPVSLLSLLPKSGWNLKNVMQIYPFKMLFARHYLVSASKS